MSRDELGEELREFLIESTDNLDRTEHDLVGLEIGADNREVLAATFRTLHSIKGACGFFDLDHLSRLAHEGESLLALLRDSPEIVSDPEVQLLLDLIDGLRRHLAQVELTGSDDEEVGDELCEALQLARNRLENRDPQHSGEEPPEKKLAPNIIVFAPTVESTPPAEVAVVPVSHANLLDQAIRVDVELLDHLVNLVGELVLVRNRTLQIDSSLQDTDLSAAVQRLNLITTELQEQVMKTRMQPMESIFAKLPRLVRDLARSLHKQVRLVTTGGDTELDRGILEAIRDPLVHLLRNSIDHGIESSEIRALAGKDASGYVGIAARHEGGSVIITISDDGAGIDPAAVGERALRLGLVSQEALAAMSDRERSELIFLPGFSTSQEVTSVSGRGVGMDVVRTNIEQVSGTIEVNSVPGQGTTVVLRIPLTLAIIPSLMLLVSEQRFALPQLSVVELLRLERETMADELAFVGNTLFLRRNAKLLPVVDLAALLGLREPTPNYARQLVTIVVVQLSGREFGLIVDRVLDTQEIVVKPLDGFIGGIGIYAGATILGNGDVAMILDVAGIAARAALSLEEAVVSELDAVQEEVIDEELVLLVDAGSAGLIAIPVYEIERIEEIDSSEISYLDEQPVIQYRDSVVKLVAISELMSGDKDISDAETMRFLVPSFGVSDRVIAIHEIVDITTIPSITPGSMIIAGKIVRTISLAEVLMTPLGG